MTTETEIKIDLEEFEELWVEKAEKVAAKKKVRAAASRRTGRKQSPLFRMRPILMACGFSF